MERIWKWNAFGNGTHLKVERIWNWNAFGSGTTLISAIFENPAEFWHDQRAIINSVFWWRHAKAMGGGWLSLLVRKNVFCNSLLLERRWKMRWASSATIPRETFHIQPASSSTVTPDFPINQQRVSTLGKHKRYHGCTAWIDPCRAFYAVSLPNLVKHTMTLTFSYFAYSPGGGGGSSNHGFIGKYVTKSPPQQALEVCNTYPLTPCICLWYITTQKQHLKWCWKLTKRGKKPNKFIKFIYRQQELAFISVLTQIVMPSYF